MSNKILLCVSRTGGGHVSAAEAIQSAVAELVKSLHFCGTPYEFVVADVVEESSGLHRQFVRFYNYLLRHKPEWMQYYYRAIEYFKPDNSWFGYWLASSYLRKLLRQVDPVLVLSVHPMANHYLARAMKSAKLAKRPKLMIVVTDPNAELWKGWASLDAYITVAPNQLVQKRLVELGVNPDKIAVIGMPVHPIYLKPPLVARQQFLKELGLEPERLTICLTAGLAGGSKVVEIYKALTNVRRNIQVLAICGSNEELFGELQALAGEISLPTAIVRRLDSMSDAMAACDLLITKAGGLTTFEAVARRLPMALDMTSDLMPQESGTARLLIEAGLGQAIYNPYDIVPIVAALKRVEDRQSTILPAVHHLDCTHAVYQIARLVLANCWSEGETRNARSLIMSRGARLSV